jgi:hypothetical protein
MEPITQDEINAEIIRIQNESESVARKHKVRALARAQLDKEVNLIAIAIKGYPEYTDWQELNRYVSKLDSLDLESCGNIKNDTDYSETLTRSDLIELGIEIKEKLIQLNSQNIKKHELDMIKKSKEDDMNKRERIINEYNKRARRDREY